MTEIVIVRTGGEIGIKSKPVRSLYERLSSSPSDAMKAASLPYLKGLAIAGRIYLECEDAASRQGALPDSSVFFQHAGKSMGSNMDDIVAHGASLRKKTSSRGHSPSSADGGEPCYSSQDVCAPGKAILSTGIP